MTKITDALLKVTTMAYTFAPGTCRLTRAEIRDPLLHLTVITYNANGRPATIADPLGNSHTVSGGLLGGLLEGGGGAGCLRPLHRYTSSWRPMSSRMISFSVMSSVRVSR